MQEEEQTQPGQPKRARRLAGAGPRLRSVVIAAGVIGVVAAPLGVAATGDVLREGVRNGTTKKETEIVSNIGSTTKKKGGYSTRQSNLSSTGGGAIYGCRSGAGGSAAKPPQNPCVRANNLKTGYAFEFNATSGSVVGLISASGAGGDSVKPFITNATGVATGLNADRVDGANAAEIASFATNAAATDATAKATAARTAAAADATAKANAAKSRWALVNEAGQIEEQSGGFTIIDCYDTNNNCYIDSGATLVGHGITSTIVLQNRVKDTNAQGEYPGDNFNGEVSVSRCQIPNVVDCAPSGAKNSNAIVVSPRNSDGSATGASTETARKRFYVEITG